MTMEFRGEYALCNDDGTVKEAIKNMLTDEGEKLFLEILMQGAAEATAPTGWWIGCCAEPVTVDETLTLAGLSEPTTGGYARISLGRNATDWPIVDEVGNMHRALSKLIAFVGTGAGWDVECNRLFLCNAATGTAAQLVNISGAFTTPVQLADTGTFPVRYALFVR